MANAMLGYLAAAFSGASNLFLMRYRELENGIKVKNKEGDVVYGDSKVAGKRAIIDTAITRFFLPLPVLLFPAIANFFLGKANLLPKNVKVAKLLEIFLCISSLTVALPMSIAIFNPQGVITSD